MANGWDDSGIDWTSAVTMRNSRTEDIIKEIYLAVNEREYWVRKVKFMDIKGGQSVLDSDGRIRTPQALKYIQDIVSGWFLPIADLGTRMNIFSSRQSIGTFCCFFDDVYDATGTGSAPYEDSVNSYFFGFKNLDYAAGGNTETQYNLDLSLLRTPPKRVSLIYLKLIYDLLQLDLKTGVEDWLVDDFLGFDRFLPTGAKLVADANFATKYMFTIQDNNNGQEALFADTVDEINSLDNLRFRTGSTIVSQLSYASFYPSLRIITYRDMFAYSIDAFSSSFNIKDLEPSSIHTGYNRPNQDNLGLIPYSNFKYGVFKDVHFLDTLTQARIDAGSGGGWGIVPGDYYVFEDIKTSFDYYQPAITDSGQSNAQSRSAFMVKFNKEDFIYYYTQP
tara:strand:- start:58 stop:1230 length:1173 start_codon:yes stop_codon:yes gene_type:complete